MVATPNRFNELEKVIRSLRKFHNEPIQVMIANDRYQAHEFKTMCGLLSPFDNTIMMDIDMFVLQNFKEVFDFVKDGKIAMYEEKEWGIYNSGFVGFEKNLMKEISEIWHNRYINKDFRDKRQWKGLWEQDILTNILKRRDKFQISKHQIFNLPKFYNYCIYKFKPEEELRDWEQIKVLHYWYRSGNKPNPKRKSWRVWLGEEIMTKKNPNLLDEIKRLLEIYQQKPRLNSKRIGVLVHLLEFAGGKLDPVSQEGPKDTGKTFGEMEDEKKKQDKQRKKVEKLSDEDAEAFVPKDEEK